MGRGAKIDNMRPDMLILDDIDKDQRHRIVSPEKDDDPYPKNSPSGGPNVAILAVQNLVHSQSVFARLADGRAEFLTNRTVSGPYPALKSLAYTKDQGRVVLTHGEPTWDHLNLQRCQKIVDDIGLTAFLAEYQHDKSAQQGAFFADLWVESILCLDPFPIPSHWRIDRSFDYGYSAPFSVGWWATADGETLVAKPGPDLSQRHPLFGSMNGMGGTGKRIKDAE